MNKTKKFKPSNKEVALIIIASILFVILVSKSLFFDAYKPDVNEELEFITQHIEQTYDGFLYDKGILKIRLIDYKNHEDGQNIRLRRYFLGLLPMGDIYDFLKTEIGD